MFRGIPFQEGGKLLGDGLEEANDDTDWSRLHIVAKFLDNGIVWYSVVAIKLHAFPNAQQNRGENKDCRPVLELVATVNT